MVVWDHTLWACFSRSVRVRLLSPTPGEDGRRLPQVGISSATFLKWKAKYGGLEVSYAERLQSLEDENGKLKKAVG